EPIMWVLWVIKNQFKISAYVPAGMLANIMVDGIGKSADEQSIKNGLAHAIGTKVHRKIEDGQHAYKIMEEGIKHLEKLAGKSNKTNSERIYQSGQQYDVYKDLKKIVLTAKKEVFIVDAYTDETLYDLYIDSIPKKVLVKILTKNPPKNFITIGKMLSQQRSMAIVDSKQVHDRCIFVDGDCWILGSSIKDAAAKKPTTFMKLVDSKGLYQIWDGYFKSGTKLV
ncbi:MAG TPA: hypothetical protein VFA69_08070, partial [Candidatus Nitrosotalea sp.]|nr:hypothetical protein [Candidatus Nitrosotalea sp.]